MRDLKLFRKAEFPAALSHWGLGRLPASWRSLHTWARRAGKKSDAADDKSSVEQSLTRHLMFAFAVIGLLVGGFGVAAAVIEINGAVIAPGNIVVESSVKRIQHREGGIVTAIHVRQGQTVKAGDLLVTLDDTIARANLAIVSARLDELQAQEARLKAERDGQTKIIFPVFLLQRQSDPEITAILDGQRTLLRARLETRTGRKAQLAEQIKQLQEEIKGLESQRDGKAREARLVTVELQDLGTLIEKGLIQQSRITALRRDKARLEGEHGGFVSQISQVAQAISEREIQILQIDEEMRAEVVEQLPAVRGEIAQLMEQKVAAEEQLRRVSIRSPRAGFVHQLAVHTVGGVVAPGEDVMMIVPDEDVLLIQAQVSPTDIDDLAPAQKAFIRLPGLDQRSTPELRARIDTVSADLMQDPISGAVYYQARLSLDEEELSRLNEEKLIPGMPVEAFVQTGSRTILSYLLKPLADQIAHAWREN